MEFGQWLGSYLPQALYPASLSSGLILCKHTSGRKVERIGGSNLFGGRAMIGRAKACPPTRCGKTLLEEARRARVRFIRTGPEDAVLGGNLFIGEAHVISRAARTGRAQFLEDLAGVLKGEVVPFAQAASQFTEYLDLV